MSCRAVASVVTVGLVACGQPGRPAPGPVAAPPTVIADAAPPRGAPTAVDAAAPAPVLDSPLARWSAAPAGAGRPGSPACVTARDRFLQYVDLADDAAAVRFCLWWNLGNPGFPDVGCWRVALDSGAYHGEGGVWFSQAQPMRVGVGGPALGDGPVSASWRDQALEICDRGTCRRLRLPQPAGATEDDLAVDATGSRVVIGLAHAPGDRTRLFAVLDPNGDTVTTSLTIPQRHELALGGFVGSSLMIVDCAPDLRGGCAWDLYDTRTGARIGAVGGARPLGEGGSAVRLDATRFAAVAGAHLVIQDAITGQVAVSQELARPRGVEASYVVLTGAGAPGSDGGRASVLVVVGPDGRVLRLDPATGRIVRAIIPPRCPG